MVLNYRREMIGALLTPLLGKLTGNGLNFLADAVMVKGKQAVENILGVDLEEALKTPEQRAQLKQLEMEHEETLLKLSLEEKKVDYAFVEKQEQQISDRWLSDNKDGSWLAKNVRPAGFAFWTVLFGIVILIDGNLITLNQAWPPIIQNVYMMFLGSYIGARAYEKVKGVAK